MYMRTVYCSEQKLNGGCLILQVQEDGLCGGERMEVRVEWTTLNGHLTQQERLFFSWARAEGHRLER
jgi:hypothetical protein